MHSDQPENLSLKRPPTQPPIVTQLADRLPANGMAQPQKARGDLPGSLSAIGASTTRYRAGQHRVYGETAVWALQ